nr:hypothetical protein Iba_chr04bCG10490 [Ipomoea batatas]GMC92337.1 hypothetical protein Iba_chr05aCG10090 [Ipomoea batatas]GMC95845.1 hypothetical protein Iba_chr05cCG12490 [Ipomoea batatas]GMC99782.1 hypothetical protein Iba_chr05eCG8980 [Ipomoea batatas]GMD17520.1 hypothetical protein Iba_chr07dCG4360 [Ipomoea batatas]
MELFYQLMLAKDQRTFPVDFLGIRFHTVFMRLQVDELRSSTKNGLSSKGTCAVLMQYLCHHLFLVLHLWRCMTSISWQAPWMDRSSYMIIA